MWTVLIVLCSVATLATSNSADYTNFAEWGGDCNIGHSQSPVNLVSSGALVCGRSRFRINMWNGTTTVRPGLGHHSSLKSEYPSSILTIVDSTGKLLQYISLQYHLHTPSEHTINGARMDLELHVVHSINSDLFSDDMKLAVVGLLFTQVDENSTQPTIFDQMDFTAGSFVVNFNTTVGRYLQDENVFHYRGSLTTPSCSEIVNWFVVQKVFPIRPSQLQAIKLQLNDDEPNSRPVQDLNQRSIFYITPSCNLDFTFEVTKRMQLSSGKMQAAVLLMLLAFVFFL